MIPLGLLHPSFLERRILQHLCEKSLQGDEIVPQSIQDNWEEWERNIQQLSGIKIQICFIANGSKQIKHYSLHHFADSSEESYGQVIHLRTVD